MALTFAQEKTRDIKSEAEPLLRAHWLEVGRHRDVMILDPDWPTILQHERNGHWRSFTIRDGGQLVGYAAFMVRRSLHYAQIIAVCDVLYIDPRHRAARVTPRFVAYCDDALRDSGVFLVYQRQKKAFPTLGRLLGRLLGYVPIEDVLERRLG